MAGSSVDDRVFDVIAVEHTSPLRLLVAAVCLFAGRSGEAHGVLRLRLRGFGVHADRGLQVALDGEVCAALPGYFEVAGNALRVVTPWEFEDIDD
jgi:diacylglycerol kinase family enzyme